MKEYVMKRFALLLCLVVLTVGFWFPSTNAWSATLIQVPRIHVEPLYFDNGTYCESYQRYNDVWSCPTPEITNECTLQSSTLIYSEFFCY